MKLDKKQNRLRRARKARAKISELEVNRLSVHRTPRHIYAQVIGPDGSHFLDTGKGHDRQQDETSFHNTKGFFMDRSFDTNGRMIQEYPQGRNQQQPDKG